MLKKFLVNLVKRNTVFKQNLNMNEFWDTLCTEYILYSLQFLFVKRDFCKYQHLINSDNTAKNLAQHYKKIAFSASTIEKRPIEMPDWSLSCLYKRWIPNKTGKVP